MGTIYHKRNRKLAGFVGGQGSGIGDRIMNTIWDMSNMYERRPHGVTQGASGEIVLGQKRTLSARDTDLGVITFYVSVEQFGRMGLPEEHKEEGVNKDRVLGNSNI